MRQTTSNRTNLKYESLENREMMAADISLASGTLLVEGTSHDDVISINEVFATPGPGGTGPHSLIEVRMTDTSGMLQELATYKSIQIKRIFANGYGGNDIISNNTAIVSKVFGGLGNDVITGGSAMDRLYGEEGNDSLYGRNGNDIIYGHDGNDFLYGGNGHDRLVGSAGNDYLSGSGGNDYMDGSSGNDSLYGSTGNDQLLGSGGHDFLYGSHGNDILDGSHGNDMLSGYLGNDQLYGGDGQDSLKGGEGNDLLHGGSGHDDLNGSLGDDLLSGDAGHDDLAGGPGADTLYGGKGRDTLQGGTENDGLFGGLHPDDLHGGGGHDRFLNEISEHHDSDTKTYPYQSFYFDDGEFYRIFSEDSLLDVGSQDAMVNFFDDYTDEQIEQVDFALANLHHQLGNTALLKPSTSGNLFFTLSTETSPEEKNHQAESGAETMAANVALYSDCFKSSADWLAQSVFHSVAHHWDQENLAWDDWMKISDWRAKDDDETHGKTGAHPSASVSLDGNWTYDPDVEFARHDGKTNPQADFATYFAKVMMDHSDRTYTGGSGYESAKEEFMEDFFASLPYRFAT